jgi:hypothetical protein
VTLVPPLWRIHLKFLPDHTGKALSSETRAGPEPKSWVPCFWQVFYSFALGGKRQTPGAHPRNAFSFCRQGGKPQISIGRYRNDSPRYLTAFPAYDYNTLSPAKAFLIQVYTETTLQGGIFIKKMPPSTDSKR